ncbi:MarR family winged helix-turn-helix transcriptional regulator [Burkholderia cepacia]|uniref:MarR family winged helix-turn-helix transcriptional regulator n=1 Tax=Burkholderia cepacia TaxID=292 RepID=UPI00158BCAED|nr:MarR family transcriptional regulator [Burkholderia cepacia]
MNCYMPKNFLCAESLVFALTKARNLIASEMDAALKEVDITTSRMGVLLFITTRRATTPIELAKLLGVDTGAVTRLLDKLEGKGLVDRSRSTADRRVVNLTVTEAGQAVAAQIPEIVLEVLNARTRKFSKAEFDDLCRLLRKFIGD